MQKQIFCFLLMMTFLTSMSIAQEQKSRDLEFDFEITLKDIPQNASELKIWIPYLPETPYQIIEEVKITPQVDSAITLDKTYRNKILNYSFKNPKDSHLKLSVHYKLRRLEYSNTSLNSYGHNKLADENIDIYLKPNRLVTISPKIKETAVEITRGKETTLEKARAIYDYVFENVAYDKTTPGWGNGDTERVCLVKAGNCTDFHSLFISLARASGIAAKFVIGVPLSDKKEDEIKGYHCWAEFYEETLGWVPVDISEAWKDKSKKDYYFGTIGENRIEFSQGRDIILEPCQNGEPLNYFFYPYVEVDGKEFKNIDISLKYKDNLQIKG